MPTPTLFEVLGLNLDHSVIVISGSFNPHTVGKEAPIGSLFLRTNGESWKKLGASDFDWDLETGGSGGVTLSTITITSDYLVPANVNVVCANHYYDDGIVVTLEAPTYYEHDITLKNLSGNTVFIVLRSGRIDGKKDWLLAGKYASLTISPCGIDWVITAEKTGVKMVPEKPKLPECAPHTHTPLYEPYLPHPCGN